MHSDREKKCYTFHGSDPDVVVLVAGAALGLNLCRQPSFLLDGFFFLFTSAVSAPFGACKPQTVSKSINYSVNPRGLLTVNRTNGAYVAVADLEAARIVHPSLKCALGTCSAVCTRFIFILFLVDYSNGDKRVHGNGEE